MSVDVKAQVVRVLQAPVLLPTGQLDQQVRVDYTVGAHGPFSLTLKAAEFTAQRVQQEMEKVAAEIRKLS
jgi:hypothetical protein